jgi:P-type Mg2+ transporter
LGVVALNGAVDLEGAASEEVYHAAYLNAHFETGLANPLDDAILAGTRLDVAGVTKLDELPYDFVRKRLSVKVREQGQDYLVTKGALEKVLEVCSQVRSGGQNVVLDAAQQASIQRRYHEWSEQGYRVLGVAQKDASRQTAPLQAADEAGMTFIGFLLFLDPPKPEIEKTLQELKRVGVTLKIITGDNRLVATHVAKTIGFDETDVLTSAEMDQMDDHALLRAVDWAEIFAEVDPNQKERIILALKKAGHVVGYMGDGINDAPSLHAADVGVSVENAVDVAKDAADFVLLKQDLGVLLQGILQGRRTFANTLKYVFMATSANFGNMFSMAGASLFLPFLPMLPKQVLLINFLTDLPELTIAGDRVDEEFVTRPRRLEVAFIRRFMLVFGSLSSVFDYLTFAMLMWVLKASEAEFHTGWFIESILSAAVVVFALRTRLPFFRSSPSRAMLLATGLVVVLTLALPYSPLAGILEITPLPLPFLLAVFGMVGIYFISAEFIKRWFFKKYWK